MLCGLNYRKDPNLIVGMDEPDDAGVYRLNADTALIQTVDFFTPIVDDPYIFGQIAACNSMSDVYAMGGKPLTAMNILCFPIKKLGAAVAREIIRGGLDKINEAECLLVGGHSVVDEELKYGLSVTGIVHPDRVLKKGGMRAGDRLILTKPIGTGVISTALKGAMAAQEAVDAMISSMTTLNRQAAEALVETGHAHACTDVTGFGLIGHLYEMLHLSGMSAEISLKAVPLLAGALEYASTGLIPGGLHRNMDFYRGKVDNRSGAADPAVELLYDPQTSGGLLAAVEAGRCDEVLSAIKARGIESAVEIGEVVSNQQFSIIIKP